MIEGDLKSLFDFNYAGVISLVDDVEFFLIIYSDYRTAVECFFKYSKDWDDVKS